MSDLTEKPEQHKEQDGQPHHEARDPSHQCDPDKGDNHSHSQTTGKKNNPVQHHTFTHAKIIYDCKYSIFFKNV